MLFNDNKELLNFLMTSDFSEYNYSPNELVDLLLKFRNFYRISYHREKLLNDQYDDLKKKYDILERDLENERVKLTEHNRLVYEKRKKKLSWRERITGKLIF